MKRVDLNLTISWIDVSEERGGIIPGAVEEIVLRHHPVVVAVRPAPLIVRGEGVMERDITRDMEEGESVIVAAGVVVPHQIVPSLVARAHPLMTAVQ